MLWNALYTDWNFTLMLLIGRWVASSMAISSRHFKTNSKLDSRGKFFKLFRIQTNFLKQRRNYCSFTHRSNCISVKTKRIDLRWKYSMSKQSILLAGNESSKHDFILCFLMTSSSSSAWNVINHILRKVLMPEYLQPQRKRMHIDYVVLTVIGNLIRSVLFEDKLLHSKKWTSCTLLKKNFENLLASRLSRWQ